MTFCGFFKEDAEKLPSKTEKAANSHQHIQLTETWEEKIDYEK